MRQLSVEDVESVSMKVNFIKKIKLFTKMALYKLMQFSYPLLFKFFILRLPSSGADCFDNDCSLILMLRAL